MIRNTIISAAAITALVVTSAFAYGQEAMPAASADNTANAVPFAETVNKTSTPEQQDEANLGLDKDDFESYAEYYTYITRMHHTQGFSYKMIALKDDAGRYAEESHVILKKNSGTDENIVIPKRLLGMQVRYISKGAFASNTTAKTIKVPASVEAISSGAFTGCKAKLIKASYLQKQKDGAYRAMITVTCNLNGKIIKNSYRAASVTGLSADKTITMKVGQIKKLNVTAYVSGEKKTGYLDPSILNFTGSDMVRVSKYGYIKALRKGVSTVEVTLKTAGNSPTALAVVEVKVI